MASKKEAVALGRRDFFKKAGLGAGAVGATVVGLAGKEAGAAEPSSGPDRAGYRETAHVKKYYELARY